MLRKGGLDRIAVRLVLRCAVNVDEARVDGDLQRLVTDGGRPSRKTLEGVVRRGITEVLYEVDRWALDRGELGHDVLRLRLVGAPQTS